MAAPPQLYSQAKSVLRSWPMHQLTSMLPSLSAVFVPWPSKLLWTAVVLGSVDDSAFASTKIHIKQLRDLIATQTQ